MASQVSRSFCVGLIETKARRTPNSSVSALERNPGSWIARQHLSDAANIHHNIVLVRQAQDIDRVDIGTFWNSSASEFVSSPFKPLAVIWRWKWLTEPSGWGSVRHFTNNAEACKSRFPRPGNAARGSRKA